MEAAKKASIHDFILSLPEGYQTKMTELGGNLSDGEKQRIGITRAFLHNAPIILLDEPTSNLDSLNEAMIWNHYWMWKQKNWLFSWVIANPPWLFVIKWLALKMEECRKR